MPDRGELFRASLSALERNIPIYILIDSAVDAEFQTYLRNKDNKDIHYAHVDSINVFVLIEEIRRRKQNNPIRLFSRYAEIESWLREQWAGLFREFIHRLTTTQQIHDLSAKIEELGQTTETLKRYLEQVIESVSNKQPEALDVIKKENARLIVAKQDAEFLSFGYIKHLHQQHNIALDTIRDNLQRHDRYEAFITSIFHGIKPMCLGSKKAFAEINEARLFLNAPPFTPADFEIVQERIRTARKPENEQGPESNDGQPQKPTPKKRYRKPTAH